MDYFLWGNLKKKKSCVFIETLFFGWT